MATKRSHAAYATDTLPPNYTIYGTPLPPSPTSRDDGSYLPLWKQDVRDERGRKRLHGAFTGGFSAGYFNTVGSKEGWTPSTFVSSRSDKRKEEKGKSVRPEDFMDEEDLADQAESQKLKTSGAFAGLGQGGTEGSIEGGLMGLLRAEGNTMGTKLLQRMGWREGQGIGPKIRRGARLDMNSNGEDQTYLFAPDNAPMIRFTRKTDRKGLGHAGEAKLSSTSTPQNEANDEDEENDGPSERSKFSLAPSRKKQPQEKSGIGVGILNDDGSDDEDPYAVGPKITYNRILGGDKKKKKKKKAKETVTANPTLGSAPVFLSRSARGLRKCHDGRLPLDGFILAKVTEDLSNLLSEYAPPPVPEDWISSKQNTTSSDNPYTSSADAAKASSHDPKSRASLLGEASLPGKSVFDYLSPAVRDALANACGRNNLPQGRGEVPEEYRLTPDEKFARLWEESPKVDTETAIAALGRTNGGPYSDNEAKRERYRYYLSTCAYPASYPAPEKKKGESNDDFLREMTEFHACAGIFKPLTGAAASRFTSATTILGAEPQSGGLSKKPEPVKPSDPAMEAAKMGMFGKMTRSVENWYPTRLLCKRFNVKVPEHVQVDAQVEEERAEVPHASKFAPPRAARDDSGAKEKAALPPAPAQEKVNPETNEAVEAGAAHAEVLKAIFGDSDSE